MAEALSGWQTRPGYGSGLGMTAFPNPYRGFRFPAEVIEHAVWLYHCFSLSLREVEIILAARGVVVSYESIREWGLRFGRLFANDQETMRKCVVFTPRLLDRRSSAPGFSCFESWNTSHITPAPTPSLTPHTSLWSPYWR